MHNDNYYSLCPDSEVIAVCPAEQHILTCNATQDQLLEWNVYIPYYNMSYGPKLYAYEGARDTSSVEVNPMVTLTFDRTFESGVFPFVSQLSINTVATQLNGTMISCTECTLENIILQAIIHIIDTGEGKHIIMYAIHIM